MPRQVKCRRVFSIPETNYYEPAGISMWDLEEVNISFEEAEAIRLKDIESLNQEKYAERMSISRPTFQRVLASAHRKLADVLLNGKAIRAYFEMAMSRFRCAEGYEWSIPFETILTGHPRFCPTYNTAGIVLSQAAGVDRRRGSRGRLWLGKRFR
ncbi:DUF134 domain-containing protein [Chloroflexota bacterium]